MTCFIKKKSTRTTRSLQCLHFLLIMRSFKNFFIFLLSKNNRNYKIYALVQVQMELKAYITWKSISHVHIFWCSQVYRIFSSLTLKYTYAETESKNTRKAIIYPYIYIYIYIITTYSVHLDDAIDSELRSRDMEWSP